MSVKDRIAGFLGRRPKLAQNSIEHSKIDAAVLRDLRKRAPVLDGAFKAPELDDGAMDETLWGHLVEDVFYSYYGQNEPRVRAREDMDPQYFLNRTIASKHVRDERFADERPKTRTKPVPSALGAVGAIDSLRESVEHELKEEAERAQEMGETQTEIEQLDDLLQSLADQALEEEDEALEALERRESAQERLDALVVQQAESHAETTKKVEAAVAKAQARAQEAVDNVSLLPTGIGKGAGNDTRVKADVMFKLAQRIANNPATRAALEMVGRIDLGMASTRREQRKGGFEDIVDIEFGDDMPRVLAHEKVLLRHPVGRMDFFRRFTEGSLMQYETVEQRELKRGSMIFVNDGSASMKGAKNIFARAMTMGSLGIAHRERRHFAAIEFGSPGQARVTRFPADEPVDPERVLDFVEQFYNGGTSTLTGMRMALELLEHDRPFHTADVVILSDGEDYVTDEDLAIRDRLREMGVRIHGISIGIAPTNYLLTICERTTPVHDYAGPNDATKRLAIDFT